jgi:amino acid transporter
MLGKLKRFLIGAPKNLFDPRIHQHLALMAFFAWVGLGSDGLSSSAYGPEEIYRQLGAHRFLAPYLVLAVIGTVFLISASYRQIIEQFPSGGGGYLVATKLLGPVPGIVSGCALVTDYVLTIAISIAAGCDAIFSFAPAWNGWKLPAEFAVLACLMLLNLRGVKESVYVLTPIFLAFIFTHVGLIGYGVLRHAGDLGSLLPGTLRETSTAASTLGAWGVILLLLRAFSLGGGTFTGIEAVSNGVGILREPRVENGKRTMLYMASSLAFTAGGILVCYLLNGVHFEPGRTLNASLWRLLAGEWRVAGHDVGTWLVGITLVSEGALLFVAAQTGFVDGPRTLAAMASDEWVPRRFKNLSERLVTQDGVLGMSLAAGLVLAYTKGSVGLLVVLYSINVFLTFTLSQTGMALHWRTVRNEEPRWKGPFAIACVGALVTATILAVTITLKFNEGGWATLLATGALIAVCFSVRRHYRNVSSHLKLLDETLLDLPLPAESSAPEKRVDGPTAILLVESYSGLGVHTFLWIHRLFPDRFRNVVFVSVGLVDSAQFKGVHEMGALEARVKENLGCYVDFARRMGFYAESRYALGTDVAETLENLCVRLAAEVPKPVVFAGRLVFEEEKPLTRSLHDETAFSLQRRLLFRGIQVIILPVRVWDKGGGPEGRVGVPVIDARAGRRTLAPAASPRTPAR